MVSWYIIYTKIIIARLNIVNYIILLYSRKVRQPWVTSAEIKLKLKFSSNDQCSLYVSRSALCIVQYACAHNVAISPTSHWASRKKFHLFLPLQLIKLWTGTLLKLIITATAAIIVQIPMEGGERSILWPVSTYYINLQPKVQWVTFSVYICARLGISLGDGCEGLYVSERVAYSSGRIAN